MATVVSSILYIGRGNKEQLQVKDILPPTAAPNLRFMVKKHYNDADSAAVILKEVGTGGIVVTVNGQTTPTLIPAEAIISIDPADTRVLPNRAQKLIWQLRDHDNHTFGYGDLIIAPEVQLAP